VLAWVEILDDLHAYMVARVLPLGTFHKIAKGARRQTRREVIDMDRAVRFSLQADCSLEWDHACISFTGTNARS